MFFSFDPLVLPFNSQPSLSSSPRLCLQSCSSPAAPLFSLPRILSASPSSSPLNSLLRSLSPVAFNLLCSLSFCRLVVVNGNERTIGDERGNVVVGGWRRRTVNGVIRDEQVIIGWSGG
ncbi:hypothetical protein Droror1_Dr00016238 [Drosera rotundifolia]